MSRAYDELVEGESLLRSPPGSRHEEICNRLHSQIAAALNGVTTTKLLAPRSLVELTSSTKFRPDLTLVTMVTGKPWLFAEVISSDDHRWDTVVKKQIYEELKVPRLWMVDPRYNNVEIYHGTPYGLSLKGILANRETVTEKLLPELKLSVAELFAKSAE